MGADARWVCHTCRTVCPRGGRPIFQNIPRGLITTGDIDDLKGRIVKLSREVVIQDEDSMVGFLDDLNAWLFKHEGHDIHVGSDYSTDMMDLDDYRNESVDGKVSDCTRYEARCKSVDEWRRTSIVGIKRIIQMYTDDTDTGIISRLDNAAAELYDKFSMREM